MAAFGLASGIATAVLSAKSDAVGPYLQWLGPVGALFGLDPPSMMLAGIFFGAAVAAGVWLATANPWCIPVLLIATTYAWSAALRAGTKVVDWLGSGDLGVLAACLAGGAVGAGLTSLACALFSRDLRRPAWIALAVAVGAVAGLIYFASHHRYVGDWLLYVVWQPAVAFAIGWGLTAGRREAEA
jgi:hypothetical protein